MTTEVTTAPIDEGVPNPPLVMTQSPPPRAPTPPPAPNSAGAKVAALRKELGGDKFRFKRVFKANLKTTDVTNIYNITSRGAFKTIADGI